MKIGDHQLSLDYLLEGSYLVDSNRVITAWNQAAEELTGYKAEETIGRGCDDNFLKHVTAKGESLCKGACPLAQTLVDGQKREALVYLHHKQGHRIPVSIRVIPIYDKTGKVVGAQELFLINIQTATSERLKTLARAAYIDQITGIFNKTYLDNKLKSLLTTHTQSPDNLFSLLTFELDNLREVNEEYGPTAGNVALQVIARTLLANISYGDVAARWYGGRFVVMISVDNKSSLLNWAHKLKALIEQSTIPEYEAARLKILVGGTAVREKDLLGRIESRLEEQLRLCRGGSEVNIQA